MIRTFWHNSKNFGDTLTPHVVKFVTGQETKYAGRGSTKKLIAIGSVMTALRVGDTVWGTGSIREGGPKCIKAPIGSRFLAVRGPLTRDLIDGDVPEVYGDPGILLPLLYDPEVGKTAKVGYMPHHVDREIVKLGMAGAKEIGKFIDIMRPWQDIIREMKSCEMIVTSSLHGIVAAHAYGIPVRWVKYSENVIGGEFKFQDYFLGVGVGRHAYGDRIRPIDGLMERQELLIDVLRKHYGKA